MYNLYTTYISKLNKLNIPKGEIKLLIMRIPPKGMLNQEDIIHVPELSPYKDILFKYKQNNNWAEYVKSFYDQMNTDKKMIKNINYIVEALNYNDIYLICCEKDNTLCHRSLIANRIKATCGCKVIEL